MKESSGKRTFWILKEQVACQRSNELKQNKLQLLKPLTLLEWVSLRKSTKLQKEKKKGNTYYSHVHFLI
jgi:hypothetical protein